MFELGCGEHWVLLAKVLYFFLSANGTVFYGTMPPPRQSEASLTDYHGYILPY